MYLISYYWENNSSGNSYFYGKRNQENEYEMCIEIAEEAVKLIDANKVIRADISDIAIKAAKEIEYENVAHFYKAAFYSNPNSWHLLRLFMLENKNVLEEALKMVQTLEPVSFQQNTGSVENRKVTIYDRNQKNSIFFCWVITRIL